MITPIQTLYLHLQTQGLFDDWTGPDSSTQPAPTIQMRELLENEVPSDERILLIRNVSAGGGDRYVSTPNIAFVVMGKTNETPVFAETYAGLIYEALLDFDEADCIISIEPMGRIGGPYTMDSGRRVYEIEFIVNVDSGRIQQG